jgi:hypothetical protein
VARFAEGFAVRRLVLVWGAVLLVLWWLGLLTVTWEVGW